MKRKSWYFCLPLSFVFCLFLNLASAEDITITTYYPSPYGSYNELTTHSNTYLAIDSGNVGIGTTNPQAKLVVMGGNVGIGTTAPDGVLEASQSIDGGDAALLVGNIFNASGSRDETSSLDLGFYNDNGRFRSGVRFQAGKSGDYTSAAQRDAFLQIQTSRNGNIIDAVKITRGGNVGIGTTDPNTNVPNGVAGNLDVNDVYLRSTARWVSNGPELAQARRSDGCTICPIVTMFGDSNAFVPLDNVNADSGSSWYMGSPTPDKLDGIGCASGWRLVGCWVSNRGAGADDADMAPYDNGCVTNDFDQTGMKTDLTAVCMKYN